SSRPRAALRYATTAWWSTRSLPAGRTRMPKASTGGCWSAMRGCPASRLPSMAQATCTWLAGYRWRPSRPTRSTGCSVRCWTRPIRPSTPSSSWVSRPPSAASGSGGWLGASRPATLPPSNISVPTRIAAMPYRLVLLRHGESDWNAKNLFTGWVDVGLTEKGRAEALRGAELLAERDLLPDIVHTSVLRRAIRTAEITLDAAERHWIPVRRSWRLNERHYVAQPGKNNKLTLAVLG